MIQTHTLQHSMTHVWPLNQSHFSSKWCEISDLVERVPNLKTKEKKEKKKKDDLTGKYSVKYQVCRLGFPIRNLEFWEICVG